MERLRTISVSPPSKEGNPAEIEGEDYPGENFGPGENQMNDLSKGKNGLVDEKAGGRIRATLTKTAVKVRADCQAWNLIYESHSISFASSNSAFVKWAILQHWHGDLEFELV